MSKQTLYNLQKLIGEKTFSVGSVVRADPTDPRFCVPVTFEKTLSVMRDFSITGYIKIGSDDDAEIIYQTGSYSYGLEPLIELIKKKKKLGIGRASLVVEITDHLISVIPTEPRPEWMVERAEYYYIPSNWIDVSTPEGMAFLQDEVEHASNPSFENFEERASRYTKYGIPQNTVTNLVIYDSDNSVEENINMMCSFCKEYELNTNIDAEEFKKELLSILS